MKSKYAIRWIEALLSGKYKQGRGRLGNKERGYCCWRVACVITETPFTSYETWHKSLNKKIGFLHSSGDISPIFYKTGSLATLNDSTKAGFKRIGKYLIKHAETNFEPEVAKAIKNHFK